MFTFSYNTLWWTEVIIPGTKEEVVGGRQDASQIGEGGKMCHKSLTLLSLKHEQFCFCNLKFVFFYF